MRYEQRLIQQAVVARTGQRFLDGQTTDEKLFKHLMDNAIASKQTLNLSVGVNLTSEQVAALTHDIVWLEKSVVNGEEVLVPVLYLANANNRLDLLAGNNIVNKAGGIIAGRDVTMTAVNGDVINERTVTGHDSSDGLISEHSDFLNSAARIEAANDLSIRAGRDFLTQGSVLQSGRDTTIQAGRDLSFGSVEQVNSNANTSARNNSSSVMQNGSSVTAGRDLSAVAGRDLTAIASRIDAKRDVAMSATENLSLISAADEQHSALNLKKVKAQEDHVSQVSTTLSAGGDVSLSAGKDLAMIASRVTAGDEAYLVAGGKLGLLAAEDSDYSLYDMKKKGSWGSKKTQRDEVTQVTNVGSEIKTGGDLTLQSGGDQKYQAAKLDSGGDIAIVSGGAVTFEAVKDLRQESHEKSNNNAFWVSSKGKGSTDETLRQTQMVAEGSIAIKAVEGLKIDVNQVNQQTVSQSIDAMVKADPQLAWIKDAEARGDVDWRQVKEIHDSFKYSNSGLGPASQIIIAILMAAVVGPMAAGAMGTATGGMVTAGTLSVEAAAGISAATGAVAAGAATNATVSVINNRGNLGAVLKDVTSSDAMKGYVISGATAGFTAAYFDGWTGTHTDTATGKIIGPKLYTVGGVGQFAANQALQNGTSLLLSKALGQGGSASDALKNALFNTLAAASFNAVGDYTKGVFADGSAQKIAIHAMVGGLLAEATGGDFKTGALAAGANEALVADLNKLVKGDERLLTMSSQIVGVLAAAGQKDADASKLEKGKWIAQNSTQYNFLGDHSAPERDKAREAFEKDRSIGAAKTLVTLEGADQRSDNLLAAYKQNPGSLSRADIVELNAYLQVYAYEQTAAKGEAQALKELASLLTKGPTPSTEFSYAGTTDAKNAYADAARSELSWAEQFSWSRDRSANELTYRDAKGVLRENNEQQGLANIGSPAIYGLSGPLGASVRIAAAANGVLQAGHGANQAINGDGWNAAGNLLFGALAIAGLGIPGAKPSVTVGAKRGGAVAEVSPVSKGSFSASQVDGDFGYLNQPAPFKPAAFVDVYSSAKGYISNGRINAADLEKLMPPGTPNTFKTSATIADGSKFQYQWNGQIVEIKWHAPDVNAAQKFPGSNAGGGWTAQIKIGNKLLGQDGNLYRKPSNITHIPVDF